MLVADLKAMASGLGVSGAGTMKKAQLVDAIKAAQSGGSASAPAAAKRATKRAAKVAQPAPEATPAPQSANEEPAPKVTRRERSGARRDSSAAPERAESAAQSPTVEKEREPEKETAREASDGDQTDTREFGDSRRDRNRSRNNNRSDDGGGRNNGRGDSRNDSRSDNRNDNRNDDGGNRSRNNNRNDNRNDDGGRNNNRSDHRNDDRDEDGNSRRNRRRRGRDRDRRPGGGRVGEPDTTVLDDDVLVPAAGVLDVLDNYAFVRTTGYLPGPDDVYVSLQMVRKLGLRRGDAVVGQVRQPREGERKEKFNPMVRIDSVNGGDPESAKDRPEFSKFTPLHANERLRLETDQSNLIGRLIDISAPIGKGQRGLIVSPPKAGKTMVMQSIANSISVNNPEVHLMVVLVDERPEEVTDFQRTVKGEVIASTFDRPAADHTMVAELAIERAKRLVELGHDVVVLLDSITRLGRAYNLAAPASGRILSGGVDSSALYPPKRFFGAARNIEDGGSLTILASALIETGSKMDEVIFEEFKGTGNMELRLRREYADKRIFPAIDAIQSGTRRDELMLSKEEAAIIWKLRRVLSGLDGQQALELMLERLKKTQSNYEFLVQVQKTTPGAGGL